MGTKTKILIGLLVFAIFLFGGCVSGEKPECGYSEGPCCTEEEYPRPCPMCRCVCVDGICEFCGDIGEPCCGDDDSYDDCYYGGKCGEDGYCYLYECGGKNQSCCENNTCSVNYICGSDEICHECGGKNQPCCEGDKCREGYLCGSDGKCFRCGYRDDLCCEGDTCIKGYVCAVDGRCHISCGDRDEYCCLGNVCDEWYLCGLDDKCHRCGRYNQSPCEGNICREWHYLVADENKCKPCGGYNKICCDQDNCKGWLECFDGNCADPFEEDETTSVSICENAEEGTSSREYRSWCYWYAAYSKGDTTLCANINWTKMREECEEGNNPDNYYVTVFYSYG